MSRDEVGALVAIIQSTGPYGALIISVIVGLVLCVIVIARMKGIIGESRFQDRLLVALDQLSKSEEACRKRIDALSAENGTLRDEIDEMRATLSLIRNQRRRLLELMRGVKTEADDSRKGCPA